MISNYFLDVDITEWVMLIISAFLEVIGNFYFICDSIIIFNIDEYGITNVTLFDFQIAIAIISIIISVFGLVGHYRDIQIYK